MAPSELVDELVGVVADPAQEVRPRADDADLVAAAWRRTVRRRVGRAPGGGRGAVHQTSVSQSPAPTAQSSACAPNIVTQALWWVASASGW